MFSFKLYFYFCYFSGKVVDILLVCALVSIVRPAFVFVIFTEHRQPRCGLSLDHFILQQQLLSCIQLIQFHFSCQQIELTDRKYLVCTGRELDSRYWTTKRKTFYIVKYAMQKEKNCKTAAGFHSRPYGFSNVRSLEFRCVFPVFFFCFSSYANPSLIVESWNSKLSLRSANSLVETLRGYVPV